MAHRNIDSPLTEKIKNDIFDFDFDLFEWDPRCVVELRSEACGAVNVLSSGCS
jgi:hypothetical protein